jgi:hypothetical protein
VAWTKDRERWIALYEHWVVEYRQWKSRHAQDWEELHCYELALAEVDRRLEGLRLLAPPTPTAGERPARNALSSAGAEAESPRAAPASYPPSSEEMRPVLPHLLRLIVEVARAEHRRRLDSAVLTLNKTLEDAEHYRRMAGVVPTPVGFHERVSQNVHENYRILAVHIREQQARILRLEPQRPASFSRDGLAQEHLEEIVNGPTPLVRSDKRNDREYVLYRGGVWECERELEIDQWQALADAYIEQEDAEFARALGHRPPQPNRETIPSSVRRAIWQRDRGRCTQCGSKERLEFDHIIPLARGGSNTERNIELLCEICNRRKSDSIS